MKAKMRAKHECSKLLRHKMMRTQCALECGAMRIRISLCAYAIIVSSTAAAGKLVRLINLVK